MMDGPFALIVEENRDLAALFKHVLDVAGFHTEVLFLSQVAAQRLSRCQPWLVVLDLDMLGGSGNQLLKMIHNSKRLQQTKVIAVTSYSQMAECLDVDPDLLLFKPVSMEQFSDFIERFQLKIKYQTTIPMMGEPWNRVTGLYNRSFFINRLEAALTQAKAVKHYSFAVLAIRLDQDNSIRDQLDIKSWISALRTTGETLKERLRPTDTVARFDQDNFYILIENVVDKNVLLMVASRIHQKLHQQLVSLGYGLQFPVKLGTLICDHRYQSIDEILRDVDRAHSSNYFQAETFHSNVDRLSIRG